MKRPKQVAERQRVDADKSTPWCPQAVQAAAWATGNLPPAEQAGYAAHVQQCAVCADELAACRRMVACLRDVPAVGPEPSANLTARILAALPAQAFRPTAWSRTIFFVRQHRYAWAAAAAVLIWLAAAWLVASVGQTGRIAQDGCAWIASHQEADGSWDPESGGGVARYRPALTAMATLALMREPDRYAREIAAACSALQRAQADDGTFGPDETGRMYNQALATWALLSAYGRHPEYEQAIDRSLAHIRMRQQAMGGWGYLRDGADAANTAVTAWQVQVLARAQQAGWVDDGGHLRKGLVWLRQRADGRGQFGYTAGRGGGEGTPTLNAMGAYTLLAAGGASAELVSVAATVMDRLPRGAQGACAVEADFYRAFFTVAAWDATGDRAQAGRVRAGICDKRETRGVDKGSWTPLDSWSKVGGRLYATSLAVLTLQPQAKDTL
jgi:hypothetical protein